jgi:hypothetical protein
MYSNTNANIRSFHDNIFAIDGAVVGGAGTYEVYGTNNDNKMICDTITSTDSTDLRIIADPTKDLILKDFTFPLTHVRYVSPDSGQYSTIGSALSAASDGDTIVIAPGTYDEVLTISNNKLHIIGMNKETTIITRANSDVINFSTSTDVILENLTVSLTAPTVVRNMITASNGAEVVIDNCNLEFTMTVGTSGTSGSALKSAGDIVLKNSKVTYTHSGAGTLGTLQKAAIIADTNGVVTVDNCDIEVSNSNNNSFSYGVYEQTGEIKLLNSRISVTDTYTSAITMCARYEYINSDEVLIKGNRLYTYAPNGSGDAYGIYMIPGGATTYRIVDNYITGDAASNLRHYFNNINAVTHADDNVLSGTATGVNSYQYNGTGYFTGRIRDEFEINQQKFPQTAVADKVLRSDGTDSSWGDLYRNYYYVEDLNQVTTTSTTYVTHLNIIYSSLPNDTYILDYTSTFARTGTGGTGDIQIRVNATQQAQNSSPTTFPLSFSGSFDLNLSGNGTIYMEIKRTAPAAGVIVRDCSMRLRRKT